MGGKIRVLLRIMHAPRACCTPVCSLDVWLEAGSPCSLRLRGVPGRLKAPRRWEDTEDFEYPVFVLVVAGGRVKVMEQHNKFLLDSIDLTASRLAMSAHEQGTFSVARGYRRRLAIAKIQPQWS
jgi:hypothetical protein